MKNLLNVNCSCRCGDGFMIRLCYDHDDTDYVTLATTTSGFYSHQDTFWGIIKRRIKAAWFMLRGKEYYLHDIVLTKADWCEFIANINGVDESLN